MKGIFILLHNPEKWDRRYLELAKLIGSWSKDPSRKIGAVAIGEHGEVLAQGYNGFPRGIDDAPSRYHDRPTKLKYVVHAEMNVIYNASLNGVSLFGSTMYVYGLPVCSDCAKGIIQSGVSHVIMNDQEIPEDWKESADLTFDMFTEAGVEYTFADIEEPIEVKPVYKNNIIEMPKNENEDKNKT
jgi:dCMP deaminase|tara:strand:+ start:1712 stop:2266 length:555 start_codon:yes stop_codon:yes gene_type:complete